MNIVADDSINETGNFTRSGHSFVLPAKSSLANPDKGLAAGVLKQAARDLRRFRGATRGLKADLYLDAYRWIIARDFSWPYSFINVCELLHVSADITRAEILDNASLGWLDYWTARAGRLSRKVRASVVRTFARYSKPEGVEVSQLASSI